MTHNHRMDIAKEVDARGLNCPLPILKAKKALAELQSGQLLKVLSTDGGAVRDFNVMVKRGVWQARVKVWTEAASVQAQAGLVLQTQGQARCSFADGDATFKTGQGGWWQEGGQTLHWQPLSADAKVIVVALCALDAQS